MLRADAETVASVVPGLIPGLFVVYYDREGRGGGGGLFVVCCDREGRGGRLRIWGDECTRGG